MGSQLFIVVSDYRLVKEMLDDPNYAGRPQSPVFQRPSQGYGLLFSEGHAWKLHRRIAYRGIRDFGNAAAKSGDNFSDQLDAILCVLTEASVTGSSLNVMDLFTDAINAVIATLTIGVRFRRGDENLEFVREAGKRLFSVRLLQNLPLLFPWTDSIVRFFPSSNEFNLVNLQMRNFLDTLIRGRQAESVIGSECLCDAFFEAQRRELEAGLVQNFNDEQINRSLLELFFAGTDTTARSLEWLLIYMAFEQDWQSRVQAEIDREVGNSSARRPTMQDRCKLHLTCAVIEEGFRSASLVALNVFHRATADTVFHGYSIPSDALIIPFIYGISRDPSVWLRPNDFYPEHFLTPEGTFTGPGKNIPFSTGRRVCVGESLARMEVFLIFSGVMQRFRVRIADEYAERKSDILRGSFGIFRMPGDYRVMFEAR